MRRKICKVCTSEYTSTPRDIMANVCPECIADQGIRDEPIKYGGNMVWEHKTAPEIEVKSLTAAKAFIRSSRIRYNDDAL